MFLKGDDELIEFYCQEDNQNDRSKQITAVIERKLSGGYEEKHDNYGQAVEST